MFLLLGFAFLSGLVTILAPCIWPLLPIVLSSSVAGKNHNRPLGVTLGIILSFSFFTLSISYLVKLFHLDSNLIRLFSVVVIAFFGVTMLIPRLLAWTELFISRISVFFGQKFKKGNEDFVGGFVTGLSLGIVWSPCAGPILATIATLAATGQVSFTIVLVTAAYVLGIGIPLFLFAYGGQQLVAKTRFISSHTGRVQQVFGVLMLLTALAIYTNYDKFLEAKLLNIFPQFSQNLNQFESNPEVTKQLALLQHKKVNTTQDTSDLFNANTPAPDFVGITKWLNTDKPLSSKDLKGKVVLVDFWTYTCINCIRTLPHVTSWYDKYKDKGFIVIGVHTPEFAFEKETKNVLQAIEQYNIHYPVPQDNDYATWNNYNNQYWPAEYLIDANGIIRRTHFGEGEYNQMEEAIQVLLQEAGQKVSNSLSNMSDQTPTGTISPETYLGSDRMQFYYPSGNISDGKQTFILQNPTENAFSLGGEWTITPDQAVTGKNAVLVYHFVADNVFLVLRPGSVSAKQNSEVKVLLDGKTVDATNAGSDVHDGIVTVDQDRLYNLIDLHGKSSAHVLKLEFLTPGVEAFAFTFG
ncbi:MAG TPA: cytochrome c biogenesis protein DipZ [Methylomirabilota bacterium]|nr:cytochrome c biogenesis protein DipZ [Methylomirabilota bacterium]